MVTRILNFLHAKKAHNLLSFLSTFAYLLKGYGLVKAKYHPSFRAYEYQIKGVTYLSIGPGWAYSFDYLNKMLLDSFCFNYSPKAGDTVIDIGAGLGEETIVYASMVGVKGRVLSIEANPVTFKALDYLCKRNNLFWCTPLNIAVYSSDGVVTIEDDESNYLKNTINSAAGKKISVPAKTLDTVVKENNIARINFLKANIEGAEKFLIEGMTESIGLIENLCISCHDFRHTVNNEGEFYVTKASVIAFLVRNNFDVVTRSTGNALVDDYVYGKKKLVSD